MNNSSSSASLKDNNHLEEEEDEDDYMSDKFIAEMTSTASKSSSSKLLSRAAKLEQEKYKRKLESNPKSRRSMKEIEEQCREDALAKPLDPANKGFQLLQKMIMSKVSSSSTTPSMPSSSTPSLSSNIEKLVEERAPIVVEVKSDRRGLGSSSSKRLKTTGTLKDGSSQGGSREIAEVDLDAYRKQLRAKSEQFHARTDFHRCQKICYDLDQKNQIQEPCQEWYWPKYLRKYLEEAKSKLIKNDNDTNEEEEEKETQEDEEEEEEEEIDFKARLIELNAHLREIYFYCVWCGDQFESYDDLDQNCPGDDRDSH